MKEELHVKSDGTQEKLKGADVSRDEIQNTAAPVCEETPVLQTSEPSQEHSTWRTAEHTLGYGHL